MKEQTLFLGKKDEWFMLAIPWIGAIVSTVIFFSATFEHPWVDNNDMRLIKLLSGLIFLDGIHIIFSFILVLTVKELRIWTAEVNTASFSEAQPKKPVGIIHSFWVKTLIVALIFAVIFYFMKFYPGTAQLPWVVGLFYLIEVLGPGQHTLSQMRGISFCYNSVARKTGAVSHEQNQSLLKNENIEKILFRILLLGDVIAVSPFLMSQSEIHPENINVIFISGLIITFLAAVGICVNAWRAPGARATKKVPFLTRVLLYPMKLYMRPVAIVTSACHGTEYLVIMRQMMKNSNVAAERKKKIFWITIAASLIYAPIFLFTYAYTFEKLSININDARTIFFWALMIHLVIRYTHYFVDAILYRMRDPLTRSTVAPLLVSKI